MLVTCDYATIFGVVECEGVCTSPQQPAPMLIGPNSEVSGSKPPATK
jgi:hypothetical protein